MCVLGDCGFKPLSNPPCTNTQTLPERSFQNNIDIFDISLLLSALLPTGRKMESEKQKLELEDLAEEILLQISSYLELKDLLVLSVVSKTFYRITSSNK